MNAPIHPTTDKHGEPLRYLRLYAKPDGRVELWMEEYDGFQFCVGVYWSWRHWFSNGIAGYADTDRIRVNAAR